MKKNVNLLVALVMIAVLLALPTSVFADGGNGKSPKVTPTSVATGGESNNGSTNGNKPVTESYSGSYTDPVGNISTYTYSSTIHTVENKNMTKVMYNSNGDTSTVTPTGDVVYQGSWKGTYSYTVVDGSLVSVKENAAGSYTNQYGTSSYHNLFVQVGGEFRTEKYWFDKVKIIQ